MYYIIIKNVKIVILIAYTCLCSINLNIRFFVLHIEFGIDSTFTAFSNYLVLLRYSPIPIGFP